MTTSELVSPALLQQWAREAYRKSITQGQPLNRAQLAEQFDRSESWARDRIAEVRREDGLTEDSGPDSAGDTPTDRATDTPPAVVAEPAPAPVAEAVEAPPVDRAVTPGMSPPVVDTATTDTPAAGHRGAQFVAWFGFAFGSVVSIAANWLAAWLPAGDMPDNWAPSVASQVGAAVWPVALLVSVEVISRTAWRDGRAWMAVRFGGVAVVALGSGVISYGHIRAVLVSWGYDPLGAGVGPLVIDGLMVVSGFALLAMSSTHKP
ncbi:hypothetical protein ABTZ99_13450 [Actinosynnema sp. NPDC002837]